MSREQQLAYCAVGQSLEPTPARGTHISIHAESRSQPTRKNCKSFRLRTLAICNDRGPTCICIGTDLRMKWNVTEQFYTHVRAFSSDAWQQLVGCLLQLHLVHTVQTKYVMRVSAICANESAHVLYHTQDWNVDLLEKVNASDRVP